MSKLPKKLTQEEHVILSDRLRRIEHDLFELTVTVQKAYGVSDLTANRLEKMNRTAFGIVKSNLDEKFFREYPQEQFSPYYGHNHGEK